MMTRSDLPNLPRGPLRQMEVELLLDLFFHSSRMELRCTATFCVQLRRVFMCIVGRVFFLFVYCLFYSHETKVRPVVRRSSSGACPTVNRKLRPRLPGRGWVLGTDHATHPRQ